MKIDERIVLAGKFFDAHNLSVNWKEELVFTWVIDHINSEISVKEKEKLLYFLEKCLCSLESHSDVEIRSSVCDDIIEVQYIVIIIIIIII